jgi:hypothetical protein
VKAFVPEGQLVSVSVLELELVLVLVLRVWLRWGLQIG